MDDHDLSEDEAAQTITLQSYIVLFCTLARVDARDADIFIEPMNKLVREHGIQMAFSVYGGLALVATGRLDLETMKVDANPLRIVTTIKSGEAVNTPADLSDDAAAEGIVKAAEFIGHMAANDPESAFDVIDDLYTNGRVHPGTTAPCSCTITQFVGALATAALTGPQGTLKADN